MTGLTAANFVMDFFPGHPGRKSPVLQTEPDEPQVFLTASALNFLVSLLLTLLLLLVCDLFCGFGM